MQLYRYVGTKHLPADNKERQRVGNVAGSTRDENTKRSVNLPQQRINPLQLGLSLLATRPKASKQASKEEKRRKRGEIDGVLSVHETE